MVIRFLFVFTFFMGFNSSWACKLDPSHRYVSLSGPITMLMEEMGLLEDMSLKAISTLHPVADGKGIEKIAGGLFLSSKTLQSFSDKVVFIDASKELEKNVKKYGAKKLIIVSTRAMGAIEVVKENIKTLSPFLIECEQKQKAVESKLQIVANKLKQLPNSKNTLLFFLGEITRDKFPTLLMVHDGLVIDLIRNGMKSYPSELSYVSWSEKIVRSLGDHVSHFGLKNGDSEKIKVEQIDKNKINLSMRGILTPGISQVNFLDQLLSLKLF